MPSRLFQDLAQSQLELLASALRIEGAGPMPPSISTSKVRTIALYLPQENSLTGQLEFLPAVLYPNPQSDRVFIASEADSGVAPTIPRTLTSLPGFSHARSLLPGYPMVQSSSEAAIGLVEEVLCAIGDTGACALSVPLFAGSRTAGVLLVYPHTSYERVWTASDRGQVARAAKTLSLALTMDEERAVSEQRQQVFADALSDRLHQVKNPLQALRTYGKLLQQRLADDNDDDTANGSLRGGTTRKLLELADHLLVQGERLSARLLPVDTLIDQYAERSRQLPPAMLPSSSTPSGSRWTTPLLPYQNEDPGGARQRLSRKTNSVLTAPAPNPVANTQSDPISATSVLGDFDCEMTFVADVLAPTLDSFRAIAMDREISFEVVEDASDLPGVKANADALQEAVSNVIDNAFKYVQLVKDGSGLVANPNPWVRVRVTPNQGQEVGVTILVEDNGRGIPTDAREAVFKRGYRDATTRSVGGSGLGLPIARDLVQKMGGRLTVVDASHVTRALDGALVQVQLFRNPPS
jgi:signal transduction histidine kinase